MGESTNFRQRTRLIGGVVAGMALVVATALTAVGPQALAQANAQARGGYPQPKAGAWKTKDVFKEEKGSLKVVAGKKGKPPKAKKIRFIVLQQDNGASCPAKGSVLKVKGAFALRKAPKWAGNSYGSPWITAKKDKPYNSKYPNMLGMKGSKAKVKIGKETRQGLVAMFFLKDSTKKPHALRIQMRLFPPGASDAAQGWCLFELVGKPGK